jgi:hypothetical protein
MPSVDVGDIEASTPEGLVQAVQILVSDMTDGQERGHARPSGHAMLPINV